MVYVSVETNQKLMTYKTPKHMNKNRSKGVRRFKKVKPRKDASKYA
jgi:hypothetical protein